MLSASGLPGRDLWLFAECWLQLLIVKVALTAAPRLILKGSLEAGIDSAVLSNQAEGRLIRVLSIAERNHLVSINCLPRAVTLQRLLRRRGVSAQLFIGAQKEGRTLNAHAWLQENNRVVNDRPDVAELFPPLTMGSETIARWIETAKAANQLTPTRP